MYKKIALLLFFNCAGLSGLAQLQLPARIPKPRGLFMTELFGKSLFLQPFKILATTTVLQQLLPFLQSQEQAECRVCHQRASISVLVDACISDRTHLFHRRCVENRENMECPTCNNHISLQSRHAREIRRRRLLRAHNPNGVAINALRCFHCNLPAQPNRPIISVCRNGLSETICLAHGCHENCLVTAGLMALQRAQESGFYWVEDIARRTCPHRNCGNRLLDADNGPRVVLDQILEQHPEPDRHNRQDEAHNIGVCPVCRERAEPGNPMISVCRDAFGNPQRRHGLHADCIDGVIAAAPQYRDPQCPICRGPVHVNRNVIVDEYHEQQDNPRVAVAEPLVLHNQGYVPQCNIPECRQCPECCCCNEGPALGNPIISVCLDANDQPERRHGCHERCIFLWRDSGEPLANLCPLCRIGFPLHINADVIIENPQEFPPAEEPAPANAQENQQAEEQAPVVIPAENACFACNAAHIQNAGIEMRCSRSDNQAHAYTIHPQCIVNNFFRNAERDVALGCPDPSCNGELEVECPCCNNFERLTNFSALCSSNEHYICNDCLRENTRRQMEAFGRQCILYEQVQTAAVDARIGAERRGDGNAAQQARMRSERASDVLFRYRREHCIRCWERDCNRALYSPHYHR